jgi:hypothetical protein
MCRHITQAMLRTPTAPWLKELGIAIVRSKSQAHSAWVHGGRWGAGGVVQKSVAAHRNRSGCVGVVGAAAHYARRKLLTQPLGTARRATARMCRRRRPWLVWALQRAAPHAQVLAKDLR